MGKEREMSLYQWVEAWEKEKNGERKG